MSKMMSEWTPDTNPTLTSCSHVTYSNSVISIVSHNNFNSQLSYMFSHTRNNPSTLHICIIKMHNGSQLGANALNNIVNVRRLVVESDRRRCAQLREISQPSWTVFIYAPKSIVGDKLGEIIIKIHVAPTRSNTFKQVSRFSCACV